MRYVTLPSLSLVSGNSLILFSSGLEYGSSLLRYCFRIHLYIDSLELQYATHSCLFCPQLTLPTVTPPAAVGYANGVAQSIVSLARCVGPVIGGYVSLQPFLSSLGSHSILLVALVHKCGRPPFWVLHGLLGLLGGLRLDCFPEFLDTIKE